jgi:hypothetical protein
MCYGHAATTSLANTIGFVIVLENVQIRQQQAIFFIKIVLGLLPEANIIQQSSRKICCFFIPSKELPGL